VDATEYVALWVDNDQGLYSMKEKIMTRILRGVESADRAQYRAQVGAELKEMLWPMLDAEAYLAEYGTPPPADWFTSGMRQDILTSGQAIADIDWESLAEGWEDDVDE